MYIFYLVYPAYFKMYCEIYIFDPSPFTKYKLYQIFNQEVEDRSIISSGKSVINHQNKIKIHPRIINTFIIISAQYLKI